MIRWRGRALTREEQVVNARDSFVNLAPVSEAPAAAVRSAWSATLPGQNVPLIWEMSHGGEEELY